MSNDSQDAQVDLAPLSAGSKTALTGSSASPARQSHSADDGAGSFDVERVMDIPVQLTVQLGRARIPIKQVIQLTQGSVIELGAAAGDPMDVLINGFLIAQGEVVVVNEKFGIRLTDIMTPAERLRRLSGA